MSKIIVKFFPEVTEEECYEVLRRYGYVEAQDGQDFVLDLDPVFLDDLFNEPKVQSLRGHT